MHNQNETQQHRESRHVERTFLYTYVPNSDAESFLYSAGRCFYCTHVSSAYWLLGMYAYLATNRNDHLPHKRRSQ